MDKRIIVEIVNVFMALLFFNYKAKVELSDNLCKGDYRIEKFG
tara:strand:- start:32324 stop:32452 length:129 start_codon:yes stop_codon:yes gene_type:complete